VGEGGGGLEGGIKYETCFHFQKIEAKKQYIATQQIPLKCLKSSLI
jgi:hypothetical protein